MPEEVARKKLLTADEIEAEINDLARHGEGSDKRWALNKLSNKAEAEVILPPPLDDADVKKRLARLMRGANMALTKASYVDAFQNAPIEKVREPVVLDDVTVIDVETLPNTLKRYYNKYPWKKKAGMPPGYPQGHKNILKQQQWCQQASLEEERILLKAKAAPIVADMTNIGGVDPTDGNDAEAPPGPTEER